MRLRAPSTPPSLPSSLFLRYTPIFLSSSSSLPLLTPLRRSTATAPSGIERERARRKGELVFFIGAVRHCLLRSVGHEPGRVIEEMALLGPSIPRIDFLSISFFRIDRNDARSLTREKERERGRKLSCSKLEKSSNRRINWRSIYIVGGKVEATFSTSC